mmetsp:Transcript_36349/g.87702  ORF Transcript_36349/g.87702 Transcript_36349/m.87702 type:complete len:303 (+) Transcript_36349:1682-2590(+)
MASISAIQEGCALGCPPVVDCDCMAEEARVVRGWGWEEEGASKDENIDANTDRFSAADDDASSAAAFTCCAGAETPPPCPPTTADPARVPKALMPTSALFLLSSASSRLRSLVFFLIALILAVTSSLSSFSASSSVSARIPSGFLIPEAVLSEVLSIQWQRVRRFNSWLSIAELASSSASPCWLEMSDSNNCVASCLAHNPVSILKACPNPDRPKYVLHSSSSSLTSSPPLDFLFSVVNLEYNAGDHDGGRDGAPSIRKERTPSTNPFAISSRRKLSHTETGGRSTAVSTKVFISIPPPPSV